MPREAVDEAAREFAAAVTGIRNGIEEHLEIIEASVVATELPRAAYLDAKEGDIARQCARHLACRADNLLRQTEAAGME